MPKRAIETDLGMPEGDARKLHMAEENAFVSSLSPQQETRIFALTLNIGSIRKFSFSYDVAASRKRRANLIANGRSKFAATDWE